MESNDNKIQICRATLKILKYSLIWPSEDDEMNPGKWYYIRIITFLLITSPWCVSVFMHLVMTLKNNVDLHISEDISMIVAFCGLYYMIIIYVKNQPKMALLLRDLSNFDNFGKPPGFEEEEKNLSRWSTFFFGYTIVGVSVYNCVKLAQKPDCEKRNEEKHLSENCGILSPTWFPFKINYFPAFQLVFLYVFMSTQLLMKLGLMISFNSLEMAHHVILRINHLRIMILECFDDEDYHGTRNRLRKCISYHLEISNFAARLDDCFSDGMFAHLTITGLICGCLEKQFVDGDSKLCAFIHLSGWIMALFIACVGGQHLINASELIPEAIWSSKWYRADVRLRKDLLFMLIRAQKGLYITAGAFGFVSFPLFVSVLKMSYSILAMLKS